MPLKIGIREWEMIMKESVANRLRKERFYRLCERMHRELPDLLMEEKATLNHYEDNKTKRCPYCKHSYGFNIERLNIPSLYETQMGECSYWSIQVNSVCSCEKFESCETA